MELYIYIYHQVRLHWLQLRPSFARPWPIIRVTPVHPSANIASIAATNDGCSRLHAMRCCHSPAYLRAACSYSQKRSVARFILSNAPIRVNTEPNTPFCERTCRRCMAADVDNEAHTLLHCTYLADVRESYQYLFLDCNDIAEFMQAGYNPDTAPDFVKCIHKVMTKLEHPPPPSASHQLTAGKM